MLKLFKINFIVPLKTVCTVFEQLHLQNPYFFNFFSKCAKRPKDIKINENKGYV